MRHAMDVFRRCAFALLGCATLATCSEPAVSPASDTTVVADNGRWEVLNTLLEADGWDGYVVTSDARGFLYVARTSSRGVFLTKYTAAGKESWTRSIDGPDWEIVYSVATDMSGRIYVAGDIHRLGTSPTTDCFLAIFDASGTFRFQPIAKPQAESLQLRCRAAPDGTGNVYVFGLFSESESRGRCTGMLIKYDRDGNQLWRRELERTPTSEGPRCDSMESIAVASAGDVYVGGWTSGSFDGSTRRGSHYDMFVVKFDADGTQLWAKQHGTTGLSTFGHSLAAGPDGGVYLLGSERDADAGFYGRVLGAIVLRLAPVGSQLWSRTLRDTDPLNRCPTVSVCFLFGKSWRMGRASTLWAPPPVSRSRGSAIWTAFWRGTPTPESCNPSGYSAGLSVMRSPAFRVRAMAMSLLRRSSGPNRCSYARGCNDGPSWRCHRRT
jgi:hypothetical protein